MTCPYCNRAINAWTGFQEADRFARHLNKCPKKPRAVDVINGDTKKLTIHREFTIVDALEIRAKSGQ